MKSNKTRECKKCDGTGYVLIYSENPNPFSMYDQSKCVWCNGKGRRPINNNGGIT